MKYLFFIAAVLGILPATIFLLCDRRLIRWSATMLFLPLCFYDATAINFLSNESYRGTSRGMEVSLTYLIAATLLLVFTILRGPRKLFPDWGSRLYGLYFLLCIPSLLNAPRMEYFVLELWKMAMMHLVFMAVYYYLEFNDGDLDNLLYGVAILVAVNFGMVLYQHHYGIYQVKGFFPHQNSMAMFMLMAGLLFFSYSFNNRERWKNIVFFLAFLLASASLARSYSRGALFCYPIGGLLMYLCSLWGGLSTHKMRYSLLLAPFVIMGLIVFTPQIIERFQKAPSASGETRKSLAIAATNMMKDKPWIGVGLNNWGVVINPPYRYGEHRDLDDDSKDGIVETIYLLVGAECGIPCLAALLAWFGYYWISTIRLMKLLRRTRYFYIPAGLFGALTGVFLQSSLEWVLKQQLNFIWLVTLFAIISFLNKHYKELVAMEPPPPVERKREPVPALLPRDWD